MAVEGALSWLF